MSLSSSIKTYPHFFAILDSSFITFIGFGTWSSAEQQRTASKLSALNSKFAASAG